MPTINKSCQAPYNSKQLYALVNDIAAYPSFLPYCSEAQILSTTTDYIIAELTLSIHGINKTFSTKNQLSSDHNHHRIDMQLVEGPFATFESHWCFTPLTNQHCQLAFNLSFTFDSLWLDRLLSPIVANMGDRMVDVFIQRAEAIYG